MNEYSKNIKIYKKKVFCCNCGKYGHKYSKCNEPITSLGVIAIQLQDIDTYNNLIQFFDKKKYFNLMKSNTMNNNVLLSIVQYLQKFKFLMIRRKKTLGYIEFIRGRYDELDIQTYTSLFEQMVPSEIADIKNNTFDNLWINLWKKSTDNKFYKNEFDESKKKFDKLKQIKTFDIFIDNIKPLFNNPEWGFPKGRRIYLEKNINCACREFQEETSLNDDDYNIINNIPPIQEVFYGTDNILYKHIYYFALCKPDIIVKIDINNSNQIEEIGDIGWFNYSDCTKLIRPYHNERQKILNEIFIFCSSIINNKYIIDKAALILNKEYNKIYINNDDDDIDDDEDDENVIDDEYEDGEYGYNEEYNGRNRHEYKESDDIFNFEK